MNKLEKLEEQYKKLGEEIQALKKEDEFVPGWYMYWDSTDSYHVLRFIKDEASLDEKKGAWTYCEPVTQELLNRFLPAARYDWKAILEKYPNAKYATTDEDGRVDLWKTTPVAEKSSLKWLKQETDPLTCWPNGYGNVGHTPDWEESLETRPENI